MHKIQDTSTRLLSLDVLRGADLFLLVALQPVLLGVLGPFAGNGVADAVLRQLDHEAWEGFRLWDLVMPLFLFMSGIALPFSIGKYGARRFWLRLARRVLLLWVLGMVVQGNLLDFDLRTLRLYSNTLQAIAAGYLIAAIGVRYLPRGGQLALAAALLIIYAVPMTLCGDWTPGGNFAEGVDRAVLGRWRDGVWWDGGGAWHFAADYSYTWVWSTLTFGFSVLSGALVGGVVRRPASRGRALRVLLVAGVAMVAAGLLWSVQMPVVKRLWTSSMALYSSGLCTLLFALTYWWTDVRGHRRGLRWLCVFGRNSIAAYLLGEWLNLRPVAAQLCYAAESVLGEWYGVLLTGVHALLLTALLGLLYRAGMFLRV
ncbi:MAG: DUF5009 domain-containing protein [Alloprevotella sp.]|nr:DUF5009 domain-containing protein [Alloprevotella sp.]